MVYLIHFSKKFKHARHYLGYSENMESFKNRLHHHKKGSGSRLLRAVNLVGIKWKVARIWEDKDGNFEQQLKRCKNTPKYCPICNKKLKK